MESGLWEGELTQVTRDGVPVTVASSWTLMKDESGNASAILEISSDVTERKRAEAALHGVQEELRKHATMFDAAHDAIITLDPEGIITTGIVGRSACMGGQRKRPKVITRTRCCVHYSLNRAKCCGLSLWRADCGKESRPT